MGAENSLAAPGPAALGLPEEAGLLRAEHLSLRSVLWLDACSW